MTGPPGAPSPLPAPPQRRQRRPPRPVQVVRSERLAPHLLRVVFGGDALGDFEPGSPTGHIKLFLPAPGDPAGVAGPGGGYDPDPLATWFLIAGDESALPAIGMLLEALPRGARARVLLEVPDAADALDPGAGPGVELTWLPRAAGETPGSLLERAVGETAVPGGEARVWVAAEAGVIRRIRSDLLGRRGLDPRRVVTRGYWKAGTANHPDHDYGEDAEAASPASPGRNGTAARTAPPPR